MGRNRLAGTKRGKSRSARFYQQNPGARKKKAGYDTKYNRNEQSVQKKGSKNRGKYRAVLQQINRDKGTDGNLDNKDEGHVSRNKTVQQNYSKNRGNKKKFYK